MQVLLRVGKQSCAAYNLEDEQEVYSVSDGNDVDGNECELGGVRGRQFLQNLKALVNSVSLPPSPNTDRSHFT